MDVESLEADMIQKLDAFLEHVMSEEIVADGTVAENQTQITNLWNCREGIAECLNHWGGVYKYDLSLPLPQLYSLVEKTKARMLEAGLLGDDESHPVVDVVGYGHMGDSNLHLNVPVRKFDKKVEKLLEPWIYEQVQELKGSISAEHGLGIAKKDFIGYSRSDTMIGLMKQVKNLYDPVSCELDVGKELMLTELAEWYHEPVQVHLDGRRIHTIINDCML